MQNKNDHSPIQIHWELFETPDSDSLVRQAVALILGELECGSTAEVFDKVVPSEHAEGIPVKVENLPKSSIP